MDQEQEELLQEAQEAQEEQEEQEERQQFVFLLQEQFLIIEHNFTSPPQPPSSCDFLLPCCHLRHLSVIPNNPRPHPSVPPPALSPRIVAKQQRPCIIHLPAACKYMDN